jgi:hypothetical protein
LFNILFAFLVLVTVFLLMLFVDGLRGLREEEKSDVELFLDALFGKDKGKVFKSVNYEGDLRHIVYLPHYEWFKTPTYKWFEVYTDENDAFNYMEIEGKAV